MRCDYNQRVKVILSLLLASYLFILPSISLAVTPEPPSTPSNYVVDLAGIIDDGVEATINRHLRELEEKTTAQMVILTINSLEGQSIEEFSIHVAHDMWRLGQKGKDNGVLLLISLNDRTYRFEIGYGLEAILPDSLVGSIGRQYLVPYFRKGDYSTGIFQAALAVIREIAKGEGVEITGLPDVKNIYPREEAKGKEIGFLGFVLPIIFFMVLIYLFIRHPSLFLLMLLSSGGRRGGWGGGGFGGGFGGFGGGGGGGFGGGGASGRW